MASPYPLSQSDELGKRYGIEPVPESVLRLTQLVANREARADEITKVISQDKVLTGRLLSAANPKAKNESEYRFTTVEDGLARIGMNWVLMLAMADPLIRAVQKTFATMMSIELQATKMAAMTPFKGEHIVGEVGFAGKATGVVHLRLLPAGAMAIATHMLGLKPEDFGSDAEVDDVIGELSNIVTGNLKSNLCDAKLDCKLSPPKISRSTDFALINPSGTVAERFGFRAPELDIFVDINVNPKTK